RPVDEVMAHLRSHDGRTLVYGDDGEKFGLWPGTEALVWTEGWLERFFAALEAARGRGEVETVLPTEVLAETPQARVYLPAASYPEMGEWALPAAAVAERA